MLQPQSAAIQLLLGRAYQASGDRTKAEQAYLKSLELHPNAASAYFALGPLYGAAQEYEARASLQKSLDLQPGHPGAAEAKATLGRLQAAN